MVRRRGFATLLGLAVMLGAAGVRAQPAEAAEAVPILVPDPVSPFFQAAELQALGDKLRALVVRYPGMRLAAEAGTLADWQQRTGCRQDTPACLQAIGRAAGAQRLLLSQVQKLPGRTLLLVRMIETQSGKAVGTQRRRLGRKAEPPLDELLAMCKVLLGPTVRTQLKVYANATGAEVKLNGRAVGKTPLIWISELGPGPHRVEVVAEGFQPQVQTLRVAADQEPMRLEFQLLALAPVEEPLGTKVAEAKEPVEEPLGTKVAEAKEPDEEPLGTKVAEAKEPVEEPITGGKLGSGEEEPEPGSGVKPPAPRPFLPDVGRGEEAVQPGSQRAKSAPVYRRWWFWTAIGAAVVAGSVTGLVLGLTGDNESGIPDGRGRVTIEF